MNIFHHHPPTFPLSTLPRIVAKATWLPPLLWPKGHRKRVDVWSTKVRWLYLSNTSRCFAQGSCGDLPSLKTNENRWIIWIITFLWGFGRSSGAIVSFREDNLMILYVCWVDEELKTIASSVSSQKLLLGKVVGVTLTWFKQKTGS